MRTIYYLLQKEFLQIFRDKGMLFILFVAPIIQLLILSYSATFELKNAEFHLIDHDNSSASRRLVSSFVASDHFELGGQSYDTDQGIEQILKNEVKMVMIIPPDFERKARSGKGSKIQFLINAVDANTAGLIQSYSQAIIQKYQGEIKSRFSISSTSGNGIQSIRTISRNFYNKELDYITYMVPGIITVLVTLIVLLISVLNIVREREIGTIEQINVTPIRKYQFISGKLIPTWIISMVILTIALGVARFWFQIPFRGNVLLIYATAGIYFIAIQALGLFISTVSYTQQQAMFINFFVYMVFMLMGGIFTPIESMPNWAKTVTFFNPLAYFGEIIRMVLLKGSGWSDINGMVGVITLMAVTLLPLAVLSYNKRND